MVQRRKYTSAIPAELLGLSSPVDSVGYQLANAAFIAAGSAALAFADPNLPTWLLTGLHAGGAVLVLTSCVDLFLDYAGAFVADVAARINLALNEHLPPSESVRFVRVNSFGPPSPGGKPAQTIDAQTFDRADLIAFVEYGALRQSFSRRTFLPERGPHFTLPSGGQFGRTHYDRFRDELRRLGILRPDNSLAADVREAVAQLGGPVGGRVTPAGQVGVQAPARAGQGV